MVVNQEIIKLLIELIQGKLVGKPKITLEKQLQSDKKLSELYKLLLDIDTVHLETSDPLISASKILSQKIYADFLKNESSKHKLHGVQIFDSSLLPLPEGVRPAAVDTRVLKYKTGNFVLELTLYPITIESVEVIGFLSDISKNEKLKILIETKSSQQSIEADEFNLFRFERVETGNCKMTISSDKIVIGVIDLEL